MTSLAISPPSSSLFYKDPYPTATLCNNSAFAIKHIVGTLVSTSKAVTACTTQLFFRGENSSLDENKGNWNESVKNFTQSPDFPYIVTRVSLFFTAGTCGLALILSDLKIILLEKSTPLLISLRDNLFFIGSVIVLKHNCEKLRSAMKELEILPETERREATQTCHSAILGIVTGLAGVVMSLSALVGLPATWTIVLGGVATLTNCLQYAYDAMRLLGD